MLLVLLGALIALAQEERASWDTLYDTLLLEAADHDVGRALRTYEVLGRTLGADDPVRSEALYWLGRARYEQGEVDGARDALRECVRTGGMRASCLELLGRLELEQMSITAVPTTWTFDDPAHGFVHPWRYAHKGSIRLHETDRGDAMLAWRTTVGARSDDQLWVGFSEPSPPPRGVKFLLRSSDLRAFVRLHVVDIHGRRYSARRPVEVPAGQMVVVDVALRTLQAEDPQHPPLDPRRLHRLVVQDVTAYHGTGRGENELLLDDFQVY